jgi:hypothetical protein
MSGLKANFVASHLAYVYEDIYLGNFNRLADLRF